MFPLVEVWALKWVTSTKVYFIDIDSSVSKESQELQVSWKAAKMDLRDILYSELGD